MDNRARILNTIIAGKSIAVSIIGLFIIPQTIAGKSVP
jgi:hypothetical protein